MKFKENPRIFMFVTVFLIVTIGLGAASLSKLINYYRSGQTDYNEWSPELGNKLETDMAANFYQKFNFVNLNGAVRNVLGQKEMNRVVKLNNGYLFTTCPYVDDSVLQQNANALFALKDILDQKNISFIYMITPSTSDKYNPQLPTGIEDWGNNNLDRFSEMLTVGGIEVLDLREIIHDEEMDYCNMMYRTDHHWTTEGGYYAFLKINEKLEKVLECEVDLQVKDVSNYTITTYKGWHLGSRGQRTGAFYAGSDDFNLILPDFETAIRCGNITDTYENLIINRSALENKNPMSRYTYDTTLGNANLDYTNERALNDKKLLVVSDSFGKAVNCFLILSYSEVRCIISSMGEELTYQYINEYNPDAVIMFYSVDNAVSNDYYNFTLPEG